MDALSDFIHPGAGPLAAFSLSASQAPASIWIARDRVVSKPGSNGPLKGMLAAVKDNIDVASYPTTAACPAFAYTPSRSATVVENILDAGATVVGKTNLDQFACGLVGTRSPHGAVPNAFDPSYVSGGSSSGSAVSVALGLVDFSFGTDTAGSGRVPAGFNNIVGIKPSRGLLSGRGVIPACQHIDCVSIFARNVPTAMKVLTASMGFDAEDPYSRHITLDARAMPANFRAAIPNKQQLEFFGNDAYAQAFEDALELLVTLGGDIGRFDYAPLIKVANALYEEAWVAERYAAIDKFFDAHPDEIDPVVRGIISRGRNYSAADLFHAMGRVGAPKNYVAGLFDTYDVMVLPTAPTHPTIAEVFGDPVGKNRQLGYYTNFVNLLDLAAIAVPAALIDGMPFGITLVGPSGSELRLADLAQRFHLATGLHEGYRGGPLAEPVHFTRPDHSTLLVAVVGAHLTGLPLNGQLTTLGARLVKTAHTSANYRFYALPGTTPPKPGLVRVASGGAAIECEIWEMPVTGYGKFVASIGSPLGIGTITMDDGQAVQGFLCEAVAVDGAQDITEYGGWRAYLATLLRR